MMSSGPEEALKQMRAITARQFRDNIGLKHDHMEADRILCELPFDMGYTGLADEYDQIARSFSDPRPKDQ
jgi:hypothetical protein